MSEKSMTITLTLSGDILNRLQPKDEQDLTVMIERILHAADEFEIQQAKGTIPSETTPRSKEEVDEWMAGLEAAFAGIREGLSDEDLEEIYADMNSEYVDPDDLALFDWIDDLPEDER